VLVMAGLLLATITGLWLAQDTQICPPTDSDNHLLISLMYARTLRLWGLPAFWELMRLTPPGWPPAAYMLLYGPAGALFGEDSQLMRAYSLALVPVLLWGVYRLGAALANRRQGVLAAVLTVFSFGVSGQLRQVSLDLPAAASVLLALVALARAGALVRPGASALVGAACGLCLLTRVQSLFFISGPLLVAAGWALARAGGRQQRLRALGCIALAAAVAAAVSSPWWHGRLGWLWSFSTAHLDPGIVRGRGGHPGFLGGLAFYLPAAARLAGWPVALLALAGLPGLLRGRSRGTWLLLACAAGGILCASLGVHREPRYLLPAVPPLALLAVLGCGPLARRRAHPLRAALLLLTVGPTLLAAGFPPGWRHPLIRLGLVQGVDVRPPDREISLGPSARVARVLRRQRPRDPRGQRLYLLLVQEAGINYLARMGSLLLARLPGAVFANTSNDLILNSPRHRRARRRRELWLLSETGKKLDLPLVWTIQAGHSGNKNPLRLYRVPRPHPWYNWLPHGATFVAPDTLYRGDWRRKIQP
jgi:4-amino-4-deoxy-L-arabinose transferase-like glycosyltransferase